MIEILLIIILLIIIYENREGFQNAFQDKVFQKTIYTYLDEDSLSYEILNVENLKRNTEDSWEIIVLNKNNLDLYLGLNFSKKYEKLNRYEFVNLISLKIIYEKGGIWVDSKINISDGSYFNKYQREMFYQGYDLVVFELKEHKYKFYQKNYIFIAPSKSDFLKVVISKIEKYYKMDNEKFFKKYIPKKYLSNIKVMPTSKNLLAKLIFYLTLKIEKNNGLKYDVITRKQKSKIYYGIKLTKTNNRDILNMQILNYNLTNGLI
jgi:hypothetical protein